MNHFDYRLLAGTVLLASTMLAACAPSTPHYDRQFGSAVRAAVAAQTVDPAAVRNTNPVHGMDGAAARNAHRAYEGTYLAPAKADPGMLGNGSK